MITSFVPEHLRQIVRNKEAIIVAGAGVSVSATGGQGVSSWKGLLKSGIQHCQIYGHPRLAEEDVAHLLQVLESNDTDNWLGIATLIERKLKYPASREWAKWLKETVGSLPLISTDLLEAILYLELPIITTNYDDLFGRKGLSRRLQSIDWKSGFFDEYFFDSPLDYIFHLHGSVLNPKSVVLGISSYKDILNESFVQNFTHLLSLYKGLLFVGYGAGFDDPNFSSLLNFISENGSLHRHYILCRSSDIQSYSNLTNIYPVSYGDEYFELPNFLRSLPFGPERYIYSKKKGYGEIFEDLAIFQDVPHSPNMVIVLTGKYSKAGETIDVKNRFALAQTPVTVKEWDVFCSERGASYRKFIGKHDNPELPIVGVTYSDALKYCSWLSEITGHKYRLPTQSEWEYAALGGSNQKYWWGKDDEIAHANYRDSNIKTTTPVKSYPHNQFNLYDMHGNVWEWCSNAISIQNNDVNSQERILKGGCFYYDSSYLSPFSYITLEQDAVFNSVGLRVARDLGLPVEDNSTMYIISLVGFYAISHNIEKNRIELAPFTMAPSQKWRLERDKCGGHILRCDGSGYVLSASKHVSDYELVELEDENNAISRSRWIFKRAHGGYLITLKGSSFAIDMEGGRKITVPRLITFHEHGNFNQIWNFIPAK